ncbi:MAG: membrane protein insertase YidC [Alphaproteobacteria bacterium]
MSDSRNFFLAIALSMAVLFLWQIFIGEPAQEEERARLEAMRAAEQAAAASAEPSAATADLPQAGTGGDIPTPARSATASGDGTFAGADEIGSPELVGVSRDNALARSNRIQIEAPAVTGSIALTGGRIDDLRLKRYRETTDPESDIITLLSPSGSENAYYAQFGWTAEPGTPVKVPDAKSQWTPVSPSTLTPDNPVTLYWENGEGLRFNLRFEIDEDYLFTVHQSVVNTTGAPVVLYPYGLTSRRGKPDSQGVWILHEGFLGVFDDVLTQESWDGLEPEGLTTKTGSGWLGLTSKYWMTALAPADGTAFSARFRNRPTPGGTIYQADYLLDPQVIPAGQSAEVSSHLFAGAKKASLLDRYEVSQNIERFELAIDWGWFFFLTKPFFIAIDFLAKLTGNFGVAILAFTVLVKLVFFPLANKSYEAMTKMKQMQPELVKLRERFKDDKMRQQQEMMALYQREKINPLAGCLPVLIQIPVFFALYKVLFVTIDMRHAPFFGWVQDLSAPDPTTIFNLFGLIPWDPSTVPVAGPFLMIGVWPIVMGISMWLQMQMNPQPTDEIQQKVFAYMPIIFTIMLASFSAGLVIYWAWNNILSILQQYVIMRRMGVEPEWKKNLPFLAKFLDRNKAEEGGIGEGPREGKASQAARESEE